MILSEAVNRVIDLADKVRRYYETELPRYHRNYPLIGPDEETAPPPPEEKELKDFLSTLSDEKICQLMTIMDLGREDFKVDDFAEHYQSMKSEFGNRELAVSLMVHKAPLAAYLSDGLEELRNHKIDVDKMPLKKVKMRKR